MERSGAGSMRRSGVTQRRCVKIALDSRENHGFQPIVGGFPAYRSSKTPCTAPPPPIGAQPIGLLASRKAPA